MLALFVSYSPYLSYAAWASRVTVPWKSGSARLHDQWRRVSRPSCAVVRGCSGAAGRQVSAWDWVGQGHMWCGGCPGLGGPAGAHPGSVADSPGGAGQVSSLGWSASWAAWPVRSWSPWTQIGAKLATSTGSVLQRLPSALCWAHAPRGTLSRKHPSGCMQHLTLLVPKRGFPKGLWEGSNS